MVVKTLIAATCAAALAGSMIYFGTASHYSSGPDGQMAPAAEQVEKNIITRYVRSDVEIDEQTEEADNPYEIDESEQIETGVAEIEPQDNGRSNQHDKPDEDDRQSDHLGQHNWNAEAVEELEYAQEETVENAQEIEFAEFMEPEETAKPSHNIDPAKARIDVVFEQAENIRQTDLRDRAFLDLVEYATRKGMFDDAKSAAQKINQIELRDTARSRIAMGLARYGQSEEAFALIEEVEVDELKDVMRLQVIEALLGNEQRR